MASEKDQDWVVSLDTIIARQASDSALDGKACGVFISKVLKLIFRSTKLVANK